MNVVSLSRYAFGGYMLPCTNVITLVNVGHGFLVCTRIVYGSTISTRSIGAKKVAPRSFPCPPARRSRLHFADSASKSSPLWNFTPLRSLTSHVVGATSFGISLATEMPKLVAPTTWEVKLRRGVKFHNGEDFDAESAKWSLERLAGGQGKLRGATFFAPIDRVEIVDPYTIRVHTKKPWPTFTKVMTFVQGSMYPPKAYRDKDTTFISKNPIGTGPYKFVRWSKDEEIVLEANDRYWRSGPENKNTCVRAATMLPSMHFGYDPSLRPIKQDLDKAKRLLAEAGFAGGLDVTLHGPRGRYVRDAEVAEAVAGQLTKAGIRTTLRTYDFVTYLNNMVYVHKAGPIWLIGWGVGTTDAENVYVPLFKSAGIFLDLHNEEFNRMVYEVQAIMDDKKRLEQYHRINRLWVEELPAVPLYQQLDLYGVSRRVNWKARSDEVIQAFSMSLRESQ